MSNARARPVAEINLEEFERRLRASAGPQAGVEDPLAELTRLVNSIGFERTPSERALDYGRAAKPEAEAKPKARPELRLAPPPEVAKPAPEPVAPPVQTTLPPVQASLPPEARASEWDEAPPLKEFEPTLRPSFDAEDVDSGFDPPQPSAPDPVEATPRLADAARLAGAQPRLGPKIGGLIGAAALLAGAVVVFKLGGPKISGAPPLILASTEPTKVAPPSEETIRTANESGALLTRDSAQPKPTAPKLVDPPEAPVDLSARPQPGPSASAPAPAPSASNPSASAEISPVAPSSDTPIVATVAPQAAAPTPNADPNRVKTISVRPDGTLISSGYEAANTPPPATPAPAPSPAQTVAAADGEASSPAVALPTKLTPPKSSARVVTKTETTAPANDGAGPVPVTPKPHKPKPTPVAEAEPKTDDAATEPAPASGGGYAVQLAAPRSESEAKSLMKSLSSRYSSALSSASLGVRKAERNGETIYRVRAMGLGKAEAAAMCSKIKAAGGDCYVAKN